MLTTGSAKILNSAKISTTDAIKTAPKRAIKNAAEPTGDLIGNKIADKITSDSTELHPKSLNELRSKEIHSTEEANNEITKRKTHISRKKGTNY